MHKYHLEFILSVHDASSDEVKNSIIEFGEGLKVMPLESDGVSKYTDLSIAIDAEDPTVIFDTCAQFGRIKSVKINE